jgi:hypothetical protein
MFAQLNGDHRIRQTRSFPQLLWNRGRKACGQVRYLSDRKGDLDAVRKG